jgi:hypothetical protein
VAQPLILHASPPAKMRNRIQTDPHEKQDGVAKLRVKIPPSPKNSQKADASKPESGRYVP